MTEEKRDNTRKRIHKKRGEKEGKNGERMIKEERPFFNTGTRKQENDKSEREYIRVTPSPLEVNEMEKGKGEERI